MNENEQEFNTFSSPEEKFETIWFREIRRYPLLSDEEEKACGKDLKLINDSLIVNSKRKLRIKQVLSSLTDRNAEEILSSFRAMYRGIHENSLDSEEKLINKYYKKYKELGRVLNREELAKLGLLSNRDPIDEKTLLEEVSKYIRYNNAKYKMIHSNLRLILPVANDYSSRTHFEMMDLIQEGNFGLMKAVERFDVDKKCRFSTYATFWIRQFIARYVAQNFSSISTGVHYWDTVSKFQKEVHDLEEKTGKKYSVSELAKKFDMPSATVLEYMQYNPNMKYLDQKVGDEEDTTLGELIPGEDVNFIDNVYYEELRNAVLEYVDYLSPSLRKVVCLLYGINEEGKVYDVEETSQKLKITVGAVEQRKRKALQLIRNLVKRKGEGDKLQYFK